MEHLISTDIINPSRDISSSARRKSQPMVPRPSSSSNYDSTKPGWDTRMRQFESFDATDPTPFDMFTSSIHARNHAHGLPDGHDRIPGPKTAPVPTMRLGCRRRTRGGDITLRFRPVGANEGRIPNECGTSESILRARNSNLAI